jgi:hypothetical protein
MIMMEQIRRQIPQEEFDYQTLLNCLKDYERPRDKIRALLRSGAIIRVKKGLYVFGPDYSRGPFSRELLANLIYGPSYVSLDYALSYYGLIPERVETMTSVTCGKNRTFSTPVGRFTYWSIPLDSYRVGIDIIQLDEGRSFLMATPKRRWPIKFVIAGVPISGGLKNLRLTFWDICALILENCFGWTPSALRKLRSTCVPGRFSFWLPFCTKTGGEIDE